MTIQDEILKIRNKINAMEVLEVSAEGDTKSSPIKFNVTNKKTQKKWSVELCVDSDYESMLAPGRYALLKDEQGKVIERKHVEDNYHDDKLDNIKIGNSSYKTIWNSVNREFKKVQREYRRTKDAEEYQKAAEECQKNAIKLKNFLRCKNK